MVKSWKYGIRADSHKSEKLFKYSFIFTTCDNHYDTKYHTSLK